MKTISLAITAVVIMILGIAMVIQKNNDSEMEPVAAVKSPSQVIVGSATESEEAVDVHFTLQTIADHGKLLFQGVGGEIDGIVNPDLNVRPGAVVEITLINGDGMPHNIFLPNFNAQSSYVAKIGDQAKIVFQAGDIPPGSYVYYCEVPGHRQAGQEGRLVVQEKIK